jgi:hypothetical protein
MLAWARRLLLLLLALALGVGLLIGGALLYLDDEDYRLLLIWEADQFLDAQLEINGPFSLTLGRNLLLNAGDVRLTANDGSYTFEAGEIDLSQRLGSWLMTGTFWTNHLRLADVQLHLIQGEEPDLRPEDLRPEDWRLPPVFIQEARLDNLHILYEEREGGERHEISVLHLETDDINDSGPVGIRGEALVNGKAVAIDGRLDPVADLADTSQPYAIELHLIAGNLGLHVTGSVRDPVRGEGMDLQVILEDKSVSDTLKLFDSTTPEVGALTAACHLTGDYVSPSLSDIDIQLTRGDEVDVRIKGEVTDLMTGLGLDLDVNGQSSDPRFLTWALEEQMESFSLSGRVVEEHGRFLLRDVDARARNRRGLDMRMTGNTQIPTRLEPRPADGEGLAVHLTSPSLTALDLPEFGKLPEFGRVTASAQTRLYLDGISYSDIRLETGTKEEIHVTATGSIAFLPYKYDAGTTGVDLDVNLTAVDSAGLGKAINFDLPELGAVRLGMRVSGESDNLLVDGISLETGPADQPIIRANGSLRTQLREHSSTMAITFDAAVADIVAAFRGVPTGYLGRIEGSVDMSDVDGSWGLDRFDVASTQTDLYDLKFSGGLDDVVRRDDAEINIKAEIPDPGAFGRAADIDLAGISPYRLDGVVRLEGSQVHYRGSASVGRSRSHLELTGSMKAGRPDLKGEFVIPVLYLDDFGIPVNEDTSQAAEIIKSGDHREKRKEHAFSREPFRLDSLGLMDLDIGIEIDSIDSRGNAAAEKVTGRLALKDSVLHIAPMRLVTKGGPTDFELKIDARDVPLMSLTVTADDQALGPWLAQVQKEVPVEGYANYHVYLTGRGRSSHELVSGLNGKISLAFENAKIPKHYVDALSVDILGWTLGKIDRQERYINLNCVLADFDIKDGVLDSTLLAADGPRLAVEASLTIDLGAETIDAVFLPKQKQRIFASVSPVRLSGDMRSPDVRAIPAKEAAKNIGALVLIPYVAIPAAIFGKFWSSVDDGDAYGGGCSILQQKKAVESTKADKVNPQDASWYEDDKDD